MADSKKQDKQSEEQVADQEQAAVDPQQVVDAETEQGFRGVEVDPTPNENYTAAGVTSGAPTPETDEDAAEKAREARAAVSRRAAGVAEK